MKNYIIKDVFKYDLSENCLFYPINIKRIIQYSKNKFVNNSEYTDLDPIKVFNKIDELIEWAVDNSKEYKLDSAYVGETELERLQPGFYFGNIRRASRTTLYPYQHQEGDTTYYDFFRMLNVIKEGDLMPISLCRDRIITIIRNQRKNALIEQTKANLLQQAEDANKITIY